MDGTSKYKDKQNNPPTPGVYFIQGKLRIWARKGPCHLSIKRSAWQDLGMHITSIPFKLDHSLHDKERGIHKNEGFTPCPWSVTKHKTSWVKSVLLRHAQTFRRLFLFCNEMTMLPCEVQWNSISRAFLYQIKMFQCWTNTSPIGRLILSKVRDYLPAILTSHFGEKIICQKQRLN